MKLEFLDDISKGGKISGIITDQIIRLYEFDTVQAEKLRQAIQQTLIDNKKTLALYTLDFIDAVNCRLTLRLAAEDAGITTEDKQDFFFAILQQTAIKK